MDPRGDSGTPFGGAICTCHPFPGWEEPTLGYYPLLPSGEKQTATLGFCNSLLLSFYRDYGTRLKVTSFNKRGYWVFSLHLHR
jgi:hypothetical protein